MGDGSVVVVNTIIRSSILISLYVDECVIHKSVRVCIRYMCMCKYVNVCMFVSI